MFNDFLVSYRVFRFFSIFWDFFETINGCQKTRKINSSAHMSGSKNPSRAPKKKKSEKSLKHIMGVHLNPPEKRFSPHTVF